MGSIHIEQVTKVYPDGTLAVSAIDLPIADGQFAVLVGPSGCGKTTLLRMVAGLEQISSGMIRIGERDVSSVPARDRDIAMVFQNYALYPHMSVFDNIAFALRRRKMPKPEIEARVTSAAEALGIGSQLRKKPRALSGGQRQRVAMGRAIVREPQAFLMDEPLSNLDAKLRAQTRAEIARLQRELGVTTIYVTHDQVEAMTLGQVVAVMNHGRLQQLAPPDVLYSEPCNLFVAGFIGSPPMNLVEARVVERDQELRATFGEHELTIPEATLRRIPEIRSYVGQPLVLGVRPEDLYEVIGEESQEEQARHLNVVVDLRESLGPVVDLHFTVGARPVLSDSYPTPEVNDAPRAKSRKERRKRKSRGGGAATAEADVDAAAEALSKWGESTRLIARVNAADHASQAGGSMVLGVRLERMHFFDPTSGEALSASSGAASSDPRAASTAQ